MSPTVRYKDKLAEYDATLTQEEINEIQKELMQAAQEEYETLAVYRHRRAFNPDIVPNAKVTRSFESVPLVVDTEKKGSGAFTV